MIPNYTNHAANERTFLAWIRTGLAVTAFGLVVTKLNVFLDAAVGEGLPGSSPGGSSAIAVASHHVGLVLVAIGIATIARSGVTFERTRRAIDRAEVTPFPRTYFEPLLSMALVISGAIFGIYVALQ